MHLYLACTRCTAAAARLAVDDGFPPRVTACHRPVVRITLASISRHNRQHAEALAPDLAEGWSEQHAVMVWLGQHAAVMARLFLAHGAAVHQPEDE